jgi:ABC-type glycerol-3-phosphate transport system permease component
MELTVARGERRVGLREALARESVRSTLWSWFVTFLIFLGSLVVLFPIFFMITSSLKTSGSVFLLPIRWIPGLEFVPQWNNFPDALNFMKWATVYRNTITISISNMLGDTISACFVAYGFARFRAPGRQFLFTLVLATLMIPYQVRLVPEYLGFAKLGMVDTWWPLMLPPWFGSAFNIFLLRQFLMSIPIEMDEAAKIDGAGPMRILKDILLPQIRPALAAVAIGSFTFNWSDFLRPLIYLNSPDNRTAAVGLSYFQAMYGATPYNLLMAAALVMVIPVLLLFFFAQRYFIQGIVVSGVKG